MRFTSAVRVSAPPDGCEHLAIAGGNAVEEEIPDNGVVNRPGRIQPIEPLGREHGVKAAPIGGVYLASDQPVALEARDHVREPGGAQ